MGMLWDNIGIWVLASVLSMALIAAVLFVKPSGLFGVKYDW
jgi:branched-subunit amino acid ABC-type transport system permease component